MEFSFENWENLPSLAEADPRTLAETMRDVLDAKKAKNVAVLHVTAKSDITDYLVLASANTATHVHALADELEFRMGQRGVTPLHADGRNARSWQVVDFGTVMVHIFDREAREFYNLDKLYRDTEEYSAESEIERG